MISIGYVFVFVAVAVCGFGYCMWQMRTMQKRLDVLYGGVPDGGGDFQQDLIRRVTRSEVRLDEVEPRVSVMEQIGNMSVQKVGFIRFNPFSDTGGDNSFVIALLDRGDNGVVLSSLYLRDGMRMYAKRVAKGRVHQQLSEEEKHVLAEAMKQI